jgi:uncharacterized integral membrane protein
MGAVSALTPDVAAYDGCRIEEGARVDDEYDEYLEESSTSNRRIVGLIVAVIVAIVAAVFIFQNTDDTNVQFLFLSGRAPLYVVIIASMVLGSLLTLIVIGVRRRRRRRRVEH